jgi:phosphoribosylformylglycinamidine synthase I
MSALSSPVAPVVMRHGGHSRPTVLVLAAAGINCDRDAFEACRTAGAEPEVVHLERLLSGERSLDEFGMLVLPGGFSYGDHLGAGALLAAIIRHRLMSQMQRFIGDGRPVLGICNGFQTLARLGFLGPITLAPNLGGTFLCRWVPVSVEPSNCIFLHGIESAQLPIAHGQGRVVIPESAMATVLPHAPLRYVDNPNGSVASIAGVASPSGTVFGMMPHPERAVHGWQRPDRGSSDLHGLRIFENAVAHIRSL